MFPILFSANGRVVHSYSVVFIGGLVVGLVWLAYTGHRSQDRRLDVALWALAVGVLGARLTHVIVNWEYFAERAWAAIALTRGGLSFHGGLLAGLAGLAFLARRQRQPGARLIHGMHALLAVLTPALVVGVASGWLGCLLSGCAYGQAIPPPQRFYTPDWPDLYGVSAFRLPSQLLGLLLATTLLATIGVWQHRPGLFLVVYGVGDFLIAFTRGDFAVTWGPLWPVQWADLTLVVIGLAVDAIGRRAPPVPGDSANP